MAECDEIPLLPCCWTGANDRYLLATIGYELCQILHTGIPVGPPSGTQDVNVVSSVTLTVQGDTGRTWNLDFVSDQVDVTGSTVIVTGSVGRTWTLDFATDQVDVSGSSVVVSNFPAVQPVSGTVTALQGTIPWTVDGTIAATQSGVWSTGRTWDLGFVTDQVDVSGSAVSVTNFPASFSVTQGTSPWVVSLASTTITGTVAATQSGAWTTGRTWDLSFASDQADVSGSSVSVSNFPATQPVSGTVTANQGTSPWVVSLTSTTITGSVSVTQGTSPWVTNDPGLPDTLGQKLMAGSTGVVIASDQTPIPISGTIIATPSGTQDVNVVSSVSLAVTGPLTDAQLRASSVGVNLTATPTVTVTNFPATQPVSGTVSATQGTSPWVTNDPGLPDTLGQATMAGSTSVTIASNQTSIPVTATLTAETTKVIGTVNQGTSPWVTSLASTTITGSVAVTGTFWQATQPVSGTVTANQGTSPWVTSLASTTITGTVAISAAALPLPSGAATSALQTQPGVDIGDVTVNNGAAGAAVNVQDGGNSLTVDGTVNVVIPPLPTIVATQVSVGTVQVAVPTSNLASRQTITFKALGANGDKIYIGLTGVTALTGFELDAGSSVDIDADSTVNFFAISASGTQKVSTIEIA